LYLTERPGEAIWVKVLDFGIAKAMVPEHSTSSPSLTLTEPRTLLGSPEYMSPEQLRDSAGVDARTDIWACGVVLFELLSGKVPFEAPTLADLYAAIVSGQPKTLGEVGASHVPAPLGRLIERCLRKDKEQRPRSAYELAVALAPFANDAAKLLLPRIRAWCKGDDLPAYSARPKRTLFGLSLIGITSALAFAAASLHPGPARLAPSTHSAGAANVVGTLEPVAPAPNAADAAQPSAEPALTAAAAPPPSSLASAKPTLAPKPATRKTGPRHVRDLEQIDLIQ
jgi:serine/threonine protein kinase